MRIDAVLNETTKNEPEMIENHSKISKRSVDDDVHSEPRFRGNRHRRSQQNGFQNFNPYQNYGFSQQNANGNSLAQNQNPFFNQNAGANTQSSNLQNPFGIFQNNGGSSMSSNIASNGLAGQLSSANTNQQNYLTAQGSGEKNNAQSQSANFDPFGNLLATLSNSGMLRRIFLSTF